MPAPSISRGSSRRPRDLEARFVTLTRDRLRRVYDCLSPRQQELVELVPLLFHVNHPLLPGYVSQDTPAGVADFSPSRLALAAARRHVRAFHYEPRLHRAHAVRGLYLMGSPGTIAYTKTSDLDIWLCHDPALPPADTEKLATKARLIEAFVNKSGLEMHFFVFDADRFKRGETLSLSAESSGSSQHYLLLDEFYRSGLLLAGLKPLWWFVPPEEEHRYDDFVAEAIRVRHISERSYVDFGGLHAIPADEFFGAAVWQLYKSIESPYKSVLKLLLMETYAAEYPRIGLLSHGYKTAILREDVTLDDVDPYLAMYRKVEEYLMTNHDKERLWLLRRAFYIKVDEPLSQPADSRQPGWRRDLMAGLATQWGLGPVEIAHLDRRHAWRIDTAVDERRTLILALRESYSVLSDFARRHATDKKITENDLTVLGRKLYAAFERKANKIELVTRGICRDPSEETLSLHRGAFDGSGEQWFLYEGAVGPDALATRSPLKRGTTLLDALAWCHFNGLADSRTIWHLFAGARRLPLHELRRVLDVLGESFPTREAPPADMSSLRGAPRVTHALLFVNLGIDMPVTRLGDGDVLTSNRTDAFRFGGRGTNLVQAVDLLITTSWQEVFTLRYTGENALLDALCEYLGRRLVAPGAPVVPTAHCFTPDYGPAIRERVTRHIEEIIRALLPHSRRGAAHYIASVEDHFHEVAIRGGKAYGRAHTSALSLFKSLAEPAEGFRHVVFDANCAASAAPLRVAYALNRRGRIQVFAGTRRTGKSDLYILDEYGDLHVERLDVPDLYALFEHLKRFFEHSLASAGDTPRTLSEVLEFYQLQTDATGGMAGRRLQPHFERTGKYLSLRVFVDLDAAQQPDFVIFCDEREFASREHGSVLFTAIAEFVLAERAARQRYPIYITHLDLSARFARAHGIDPRRTVQLLNYKKRIEYQLTKALRRDVPDQSAP